MKLIKYNHRQFNSFINFSLLLLLMIGINALSSCKKEEAPTNPYANVNYNFGNNPDSIPDSSSITGLHKNIFSKRCANPGCHDGTFEPDFRTVQSSWSTLVYMRVKKTTVDSVNYFTTRVIPGDYQHSFLYERITTLTSDYMPSNGTHLSANDVSHIKTWIMNGAKDSYGNTPQRPNLPPSIIGYIAADINYVRLDTVRYGGISYNPFIAPSNSNFYLPFLALDTADGTSATDPAMFTVHKIKFSTQKDNFTAATTINCTWLTPIPYTFWQAVVNTSQWSIGTTVYFRIYVNDGFQSSDAEFPRNNSQDYYKTYYAFIVQ